MPIDGFPEQHAVSRYPEQRIAKYSGWIRDCIAGNLSREEMSLGRDDEYHDALIRRFAQLSEQEKLYFETALCETLSSLPLFPSYGEQYFCLLQAVAVIKPASGKMVLRRLLSDGIVTSFPFADGTLANTILAVLSKYSVDDWTTDFIWRLCSQEGVSFATALTCFRCLSYRTDETCFQLLPMLFTHREGAMDEPRLIQQLMMTARRIGARGLRRWMIDSEAWREGQGAERQARITTILAMISHSLRSADAYADLLSFELAVEGGHKFHTDDLLRIAGLGARYEEDVVDTLKRVQLRGYAKKGRYPWEVTRADQRMFPGVDYLLSEWSEEYVQALSLSAHSHAIRLLGNSVPTDLSPLSIPGPYSGWTPIAGEMGQS